MRMASPSAMVTPNAAAMPGWRGPCSSTSSTAAPAMTRAKQVSSAGAVSEPYSLAGAPVPVTGGAHPSPAPPARRAGRRPGLLPVTALFVRLRCIRLRAVAHGRGHHEGRVVVVEAVRGGFGHGRPRNGALAERGAG